MKLGVELSWNLGAIFIENQSAKFIQQLLTYFWTMPEIPYSPSSSAADSSPPPPLYLLLVEHFPGASFAAAAAGAAFDVVGGGYGDIKRYIIWESGRAHSGLGLYPASVVLHPLSEQRRGDYPYSTLRQVAD